MKLLLSSVLLASLCSPSSWSVSSYRLVVTQSPDVSVTEGGAVNISCCWKGEYKKMRVKWLKNQTAIKRQSQGSMAQTTSDCFNLTFIKITWEDSGRYTCRVIQEIPALSVVNGSGTVITVRAREDTEDGAAGGSGTVITEGGADPTVTGDSQKDEVLIFVMRCLPLLALIIVFLCLNKLGTRAQQRTPAAPANEPPAQRAEEGREEEEEEREERGREAE
ncbi:uncharacterized protein [Pempheris klunzingeri]|uniref:uncharacterized protein n=1 Tax=Pempheris klunzingeri TaxID=3127111 RepID=UPI00398119A3